MIQFRHSISIKSILASLAACLFVAGCSDDGLPTSAPIVPQSQSSVTMSLTRATVDSFAQAGIGEVRFFAYIRQNKRDSLVKDTTVNLGDGQFAIGLPLGENIRAFIVANATGVEGTEKFDSVSLTLDPSHEANIWLSNVASFTTDKTVSRVAFSLRRVVSRATFRPEEDAQTLDSLDKFDNIGITFANIATRYRISGDSAVAVSSAAMKVDASNGYSATINSFPTRKGQDPSAQLLLTFYRGTTVVNNSVASIDGGFHYTGSHHYMITVPLTDNAFLETPWTRAAKTTLPFQIHDITF